MESIDNNFERIAALNAEITNFKMMMNILETELKTAQEVKNDGLIEEYTNRISKLKQRIEGNTNKIKSLNEEIKKIGRLPEIVEKNETAGKESANISLINIQKKRWYQVLWDKAKKMIERIIPKEKEDGKIGEEGQTVKKENDFKAQIAASARTQDIQEIEEQVLPLYKEGGTNDNIKTTSDERV